jgi:hypothetical protein
MGRILFAARVVSATVAGDDGSEPLQRRSPWARATAARLGSTPMKLSGFVLMLLAVLCALGRPAVAADPRYPDWPCVQAKVPDVSPAAVWDGPPIDGVANAWQSDPAVANLVARLAARRIPLEEAQKDITDFIAGAGNEKSGRAVLLFAGLFDTLNHQRTEVMDGLERLERRQRDLADRIKADFAALRALQDQPQPDEAKLNELNTRIEWGTRIFDDRRKSVRYACEVPTIIERRLGALARTIRQEME